MKKIITLVSKDQKRNRSDYPKDYYGVAEAIEQEYSERNSKFWNDVWERMLYPDWS